MSTSLCFPFQSLPSRCQPLEAVGNVWGGRCGQLAEPCSPIPELLPGMIHRDLGVGREGKCGRQSFVSSHLISFHLISSFAAFRGRFNLLGSGKRLPLQRWLHTNDQGLSSSSRAARDTTEEGTRAMGTRVGLAAPCPSYPAGLGGSAGTLQLLPTSLTLGMASGVFFFFFTTEWLRCCGTMTHKIPHKFWRPEGAFLIMCC